MSRHAASAAIAVAALALPGTAAAQLHWDASVQAGVTKRFLDERPPPGTQPGFGPAAQLAVHVALLPLVHLGGYLGHDMTWIEDGPRRNITYAGIRLKGMNPLVRGNLRQWIYAGFGYAGTYQASVTPDACPISSPYACGSHGAGGGFFEVPLGLGVSYKVRKPWEVFAEAGVRLGFGHSGRAYDEGAPSLFSDAVDPRQRAPVYGTDLVAVALALGVMIDL